MTLVVRLYMDEGDNHMLTRLVIEVMGPAKCWIAHLIYMRGGCAVANQMSANSKRGMQS